MRQKLRQETGEPLRAARPASGARLTSRRSPGRWTWARSWPTAAGSHPAPASSCSSAWPTTPGRTAQACSCRCHAGPLHRAVGADGPHRPGPAGRRGHHRTGRPGNRRGPDQTRRPGVGAGRACRAGRRADTLRQRQEQCIGTVRQSW